MSDQNPNPPKKRGCFFYGCITAVAGLVAFIGIMVAFFFYGRSIVGPVADDFLQHVDKNEYSEAYAMLGDGWKGTATLQQFTDFEKNMQNTFGPVQSKTMVGISMNSNNEGTVAQAVYQVKYAKGDAAVTFYLIKKDGAWKINGANYKSPLLQTPVAPAPPSESSEKPDDVGKKAAEDKPAEEPADK